MMENRLHKHGGVSAWTEHPLLPLTTHNSFTVSRGPAAISLACSTHTSTRGNASKQETDRSSVWCAHGSGEGVLKRPSGDLSAGGGGGGRGGGNTPEAVGLRKDGGGSVLNKPNSDLSVVSEPSAW